MKKAVVLTGIIFMVILVIAGYYYFRISALPDWYRSGEKPPTRPGAVYYRKDELQRLYEKRPNRNPSSSERIVKNKESRILNAEELHSLLLEKIARNDERNSLPSALNASYVKIENDKIETGAVLNLYALQKDSSLPLITLTSKIFTLLPGMENQEVFISVSGKPIIENGVLTIDSSAKIQIGRTEWTLNELARPLGKSPEKIRQLFNIRDRGAPFRNVTINSNDQLELTLFPEQ